MDKERRIADRHGRVWTIAKVPRKEAEERDFEFWFRGLTPEERVEAVDGALESCLRARGEDGIPRLRRVHRRVERS